MAYKTKFHSRYSFKSLEQGIEDPQGFLFISSLGQYDSRVLSVLHAGVDTIKQLYTGLLHGPVLDAIAAKFEQGPGAIFEINGHSFLLSAGGKGGYRYILRNIDLGLVFLIKSNFCQDDVPGSHLKIETSPHFHLERSAEQVQHDLDSWAGHFLSECVPSGVAVHLACDLQGIEIPDNFDQELTTRAKCTKFTGLQDVNFESLGSIAVVHGRGESFTWGNAGGLQFNVYRKDIEAEVKDKIHFWRDKWERATNEHFFPQSIYKPSVPVWRLESRFHHSVVQQFALGSGLTLNSFLEVSAHLTGLWRYSLNNFRWDATGTYIRPEWQYLMESVTFGHSGPHLLYKRKSKEPGECNGRNVALALGNLCKIYARNKYTVQYSWQCLRNSGIFDDVIGYYRRKYFTLDDPIKDVSAFAREELRKRLLAWELLGVGV